MARTQARPWLIIATALMALKVAITLQWIVREHNPEPPIARTLYWTLWWTSKITPTLFVSALMFDSRQIGDKTYERFFEVLLPLTLALTIVVVYAMLHGWRGLRI